MKQVQKESRKSVSKLKFWTNCLYLLQVKYLLPLWQNFSVASVQSSLDISQCPPEHLDDSEIRAISLVQFYTWIYLNSITDLTLETAQEVCFFHGSLLPHLTWAPLPLFTERVNLAGESHSENVVCWGGTGSPITPQSKCSFMGFITCLLTRAFNHCLIISFHISI